MALRVMVEIRTSLRGRRGSVWGLPALDVCDGLGSRGVGRHVAGFDRVQLMVSMIQNA